jgi:transposase
MSRDAPQLAASIGIDWADEHHEISLQEAGSSKVERSQLRHTPDAIVEWLADLRRRFDGHPVGVAIETSRGPLVHALLDYDFIILYPVNPRSLSRFREAFTPSGAKDDVPDADLLRELLVKHRDRLHAWIPDDESTRMLRRLVQSRRAAVDMRTRLTQRLRAALKEYFPQALSWAGTDLASDVACDFLLKWPTVQSAKRARPKTFRKFYQAHNCRSPELIKRRLREIENAVPLTSDPAIIESSVLVVQMLAQQIKALNPSIARFDQEIAERFAAHEDASIFQSLPGSGPALAPRLLVGFGTNRDRFESAEDVQITTGIAPVTERSGKSVFVHWRWQAPTFLRQSFHEFAQHSIRSCDWARAYYDLQLERGKDPSAAVRALAFKWIRIIWRCWMDRTHYDDAHYVRTLAKRGSPIADRLALDRAA